MKIWELINQLRKRSKRVGYIIFKHVFGLILNISGQETLNTNEKESLHKNERNPQSIWKIRSDKSQQQSICRDYPTRRRDLCNWFRDNGGMVILLKVNVDWLLILVYLGSVISFKISLTFIEDKIDKKLTFSYKKYIGWKWKITHLEIKVWIVIWLSRRSFNLG